MKAVPSNPPYKTAYSEPEIIKSFFSKSDSIACGLNPAPTPSDHMLPGKGSNTNLSRESFPSRNNKLGTGLEPNFDKEHIEELRSEPGVETETKKDPKQPGEIVGSRSGLEPVLDLEAGNFCFSGSEVNRKNMYPNTKIINSAGTRFEFKEMSFKTVYVLAY